MLVALKVVPRALLWRMSGRVIVYCALRLFRGSLARFTRKDDRLYLLVLIGLFRGFKKLKAIKETADLFDGLCGVNLVLSLSLAFARIVSGLSFLLYLLSGLLHLPRLAGS